LHDFIPLFNYCQVVVLLSPEKMPFSKPSQKSKLFDKLLSPDAVIAEIMEGKDDDAV